MIDVRASFSLVYARKAKKLEIPFWGNLAGVRSAGVRSAAARPAAAYRQIPSAFVRHVLETNCAYFL